MAKSCPYHCESCYWSRTCGRVICSYCLGDDYHKECCPFGLEEAELERLRELEAKDLGSDESSTNVLKQGSI